MAKLEHSDKDSLKTDVENLNQKVLEQTAEIERIENLLIQMNYKVKMLTKSVQYNEAFYVAREVASRVLQKFTGMINFFYNFSCTVRPAKIDALPNYGKCYNTSKDF